MTPVPAALNHNSVVMKPDLDKTIPRRSSPLRYALGIVAAASLISFLLFVHPFLAVTQKVDADILVMEGWIPDYMAAPTVAEFQQGHYTFVMISGLENDPELGRAAEPSETQKNAGRLEKLGIPTQSIVSCPAPFARWLRTSKTAKAVQLKIAALGLKPKGINVVTAGPHARETWVAYQHVFGEEIPVGIISIPKNNYPADRWWLSGQGLMWVPKDFVAWLKEVVFGLRS